MVTLSAYGLSVNATAGWDGSIYKRRDEGFSNQLGAREQRDLHAAEYQPIVHLSTLALPVVRGDMGSSVVSGQRVGSRGRLQPLAWGAALPGHHRQQAHTARTDVEWRALLTSTSRWVAR